MGGVDVGAIGHLRVDALDRVAEGELHVCHSTSLTSGKLSTRSPLATRQKWYSRRARRLQHGAVGAPVHVQHRARVERERAEPAIVRADGGTSTSPEARPTASFVSSGEYARQPIGPPPEEPEKAAELEEEEVGVGPGGTTAKLTGPPRGVIPEAAAAADPAEAVEEEEAAREDEGIAQRVGMHHVDRAARASSGEVGAVGSVAERADGEGQLAHREHAAGRDAPHADGAIVAARREAVRIDWIGCQRARLAHRPSSAAAARGGVPLRKKRRRRHRRLDGAAGRGSELPRRWQLPELAATRREHQPTRRAREGAHARRTACEEGERPARLVGRASSARDRSRHRASAGMIGSPSRRGPTHQSSRPPLPEATRPKALEQWSAKSGCCRLTADTSTHCPCASHCWMQPSAVPHSTPSPSPVKATQRMVRREPPREAEVPSANIPP